MIFVSVGTQKFQFNRLLKKMDEFAEKRTEEVFGQIGYSDYVPKNYQFAAHLSREDFDASVQRSDLVITHGGVATIVTALKFGKPVIVVPRLAEFGEHVDDHQVEIADVFSEQNLVMKYENGEDLADLINRARTFEFAKYVSRRDVVVKTIQEYFEKDKDMKPEKILMCGSDISVKGGIVSVVKNYLSYENWDPYQIKYIPTHIDASKWKIAACFAAGWVRAVCCALFGGYRILYLHTAERGSFFRKAILLRTMKCLGARTVLNLHDAEFE